MHWHRVTRATTHLGLFRCRKLASACCHARGAKLTYLEKFKSGDAWISAIAALLLAVVVLGVASCDQGTSADRLIGKAEQLQLTRGLAGQPGSLDPQRAEDAFSYDVLRDLYEGLTASTPDGEVIPAAATSWRIEADGKVYVFLLRREARWSNGDPVTAANFVEGFRRALDPATVSGAADLLRSIENAPAILKGECPPSGLVFAQSTTTRSKFAFLTRCRTFRTF